ncbi:MAG: M50 family metallopeptidase [Bacteroidales bacterium]|nr:M50 family metallopeptidase [Bacteroidales bacterium]
MHRQLLGIPLVYYFAALTIVLNHIPVIGKFFNVINTVLHEFGHALTALFFQGEVHKIEIFGDTSGSTTTKMHTKAGNIIVSLAGYPFAAAAAYFSFLLLDHNLQTAYIIGLSLLFFFILVLFVRNPYGWFWILAFCAINIAVIHFGDGTVTDIVSLFYATTITTESITSTFILLYLSITSPERAGDATNLKKFTGVPAFIWSLLFTAFSIFMCYTIYINFFVIFAD